MTNCGAHSYLVSIQGMNPASPVGRNNQNHIQRNKSNAKNSCRINNQILKLEMFFVDMFYIFLIDSGLNVMQRTVNVLMTWFQRFGSYLLSSCRVCAKHNQSWVLCKIFGIWYSIEDSLLHNQRNLIPKKILNFMHFFKL